MTDANGNATKLDVTVTIDDDIPTISVVSPDTPVDSGTSATGTWTHDFGADVPTAQKITVNGQELTLADGGSVQVEGEYGTLTVRADGTYSYEANPNASGTDNFEFVITDADEDSHKETLTVTVENSTVKPAAMTFVTQDADVADKGSDSMTVGLAPGVTLTAEAVAAVNGTITYGEFSLSEDGRSLIFTQNTAYTHAGGEQNESSHIFEQVSFDVKDANGNATKLDVTVTIVDDEPTLNANITNAIVISSTNEINSLNFVGENKENIENGSISSGDIIVTAIRLEYTFGKLDNDKDDYSNIKKIDEIGHEDLSLEYSNITNKKSYALIGKIEISEDDNIKINNNKITINENTTVNMQGKDYEFLIDENGNIFIYTDNNINNIGFENLNININNEETTINIDKTEICNSITDSLSGLYVKGGYAGTEIGAGTLVNEFDRGDGIKIELNNNVAYGLNVKLGAFYSGGPSDEWDHYPERALLSFKLQDGTWMFQEVAPSIDGSISFTNDALISQGFTEVYISAIDNVQYAEQVNTDIDKAPQEQSDFVIQNVDFLTPILISQGTVISTPGADKYDEDFENAKFDIEKMSTSVTIDNIQYTIEYIESENGILTAKLLGEGNLNDQFLFKAEIKDDNWTVMIFQQFEINNKETFDLHFITKDSDGDSATATAEIPSTINKTNELYPDSSSSVDIENFASSTHEYSISNTIHDNIILSDEIYTEIQKMDSKEEIHETSDSIADTFMELNKEETSENNAFEEFLTQIEHWESQQPGNDLLFGTAGDDYLNGGEGADAIFGGSGNDIIVYDENDFMVSGGEGIDFMVTDKDLTMDDLLASGRNGNTGPIVDGIDVLIKGDDALSLTNMDQLASEYGISINQDGNLELDASMWEGANGTFTNDSAGLTLETTLTPQTSTQDENLEQQVIILQHSNS